jgi:hypothetical protein
MKKSLAVFLLAGVVLLALSWGPAFAAQDGEQLGLRLIRNFGYGGLDKIQGDFTLKLTNPPQNLVRADFFVDDVLLGTVAEPPFQIRFHTSDFSPGEHQFRAVGSLSDGSQLISNSFSKTFLSSSEAWSETRGLVFPLLIGVGVLTLLGMGVPLLAGRKKNYQLGVYGPAGGAVCPRCGLPFSRSLLAPNFLVGKLVRCPHCGQISIRPQASALELEQAEKRYVSGENPASLGSESEDLHQALEDSRFEEKS